MTEAIVRRQLCCIIVDRRGLHESGRPARAASQGWIVSVDRSATGTGWNYRTCPDPCVT
jgi:hypothetical protein